MGSNLIDGKPILDNMDEALVVGAVSGLVGGGVGMAASRLANIASKLSLKLSKAVSYGGNIAGQIAGQIAGDLAIGQPITWQAIAMAAGTGAAAMGAHSVMRKSSKFRNFESKSFQAGQNARFALKNKVRNKVISSFTGKPHTTSIGSPDTNMPGVRTPATETSRSAGADTNQITADSSPRSLTQQGGDNSAFDTTAPMNTRELGAGTNQPTANSRSGDTAETPRSAGVTSDTAGSVKSPTAETSRGADTNTASSSKSDTNTPDVKQPNPGVKATDTNTNTSNQRSTHDDEPEIEPGVVAKQKTDDGHEIKVIKDGRVVRCSTCEEIRQKYSQVLEENPEFKQRLDKIEKIKDADTKAKKAQKLEKDLEIELKEPAKLLKEARSWEKVKKELRHNPKKMRQLIDFRKKEVGRIIEEVKKNRPELKDLEVKAFGSDN